MPRASWTAVGRQLWMWMGRRLSAGWLVQEAGHEEWYSRCALRDVEQAV